MNKNEIGNLILRVIIGLTFFIHGFVKFQGDIANTVLYFDSLGIPGWTAYVVALIELVGGIAFILGFGTRIVAGLFTFIMIGAIFTAKLPLGFLGNGQMAGYELDLILLAASLYFVFANQSRLSVEQMFAKQA